VTGIITHQILLNQDAVILFTKNDLLCGLDIVRIVGVKLNYKLRD
jgi:hypothetical protein